MLPQGCKVAVVKEAAAKIVPFSPFAKKVQGFEHGLSIISHRTGKRSFIIEKKVVEHQARNFPVGWWKALVSLIPRVSGPDPAAVQATFSSVATATILPIIGSLGGLIFFGVNDSFIWPFVLSG